MEASNLGIKIKTNEQVIAIETEKNGRNFQVLTKGWHYEADALILANGSKASSISGSDGSGYELAESLKHRIIPVYPALTALKCKGPAFKVWAGVRTEGEVSLFIDGKFYKSERGELQLTEYGISGIPVFQISTYAIRAVRDGHKAALRINFMPELSEEELKQLLHSRKKACQYKNEKELLVGLFPEKLIKVLTSQKHLISAIKEFPLEVQDGMSFSQAQVCSGGVDTIQVNEMSGIVIEKVRKSFDTKDGVVEALKDVNLNIDSGDIYGIIGMSGAGKSTLVRCMNFLEVPTEGQVLIDGKALGDLTEKELRKQREEIGMIFQHFNLLMQKSVIDNVCFPLYIKGKKKAEARKRAAELLEIVGLGDRQNAYPAQLSGGQKQRVAIARALASDPKILLCDEATSALDPQTTSSILELLKKINKQFGITIVIITHQMSVVREICTHVAIMYEGEVVEKGLVADIFANPQSEVAKELIRKDTGSDIDADSRLDAGREKGQAEIKSGEKIRIVFSENSAFEPVIANLILTRQIPRM